MKFKQAITSIISNLITSLALRDIRRRFFELRRSLLGQDHDIHFFFQMDDPYSYLASQALEKLIHSYNINIHLHPVGEPDNNAVPERNALIDFSIKDAIKIAHYHHLDFKNNYKLPSPSKRLIALRALCFSKNRIADAQHIARKLWSDDEDALLAMPLASKESTLEMLEKNSQYRKKLGHYLSGMFYYNGEWYWGVDRLPYLEDRLIKLNLRKNQSAPISVFKKNAKPNLKKDLTHLTAECFISIRSPYSYLALPEILGLSKMYRINTKIRPVMPMVMRGLEVPRVKALYIVKDAKRESHRINVPFGKINDPLGQAVLRGYSLYPYSKTKKKDGEYLLEFCRLAWSQGKDMSLEENLRTAIENASLDWKEAKQYLDHDDWQEELELNRLQLIKSGLWGVPSFRLTDNDNKELFSTWGRDRIWLLTHELQHYSNSKDQGDQQ